MKNYRYITASALVVLSILFSSCVTPGGITASSTPLHNKKYEVVGGSKGKSNYSWSLFGVWTFGKPDVGKAVDNAVKKKDGDAMVNVKWYEKTYYFILFSLHRVYVEGDVVKFSEEEKKPVQEEKKPVKSKNK